MPSHTAAERRKQTGAQRIRELQKGLTADERRAQRFQAGGQNVTEAEFRAITGKGGGGDIVSQITPKVAKIRGERKLATRVGLQRGIPTSVQEVPEIQRGQAEQLEGAGAFEEVGARDIDLKAPKSIIGEIPFVGSSIQSLTAVMGQARVLKSLKGKRGHTGETSFPAPEDPESIREEALRQIRIDSFNEGLSIGESMGTLIEGIPFLSTAVTKYASGLVEDPSSNADNINGEISKHAQRATNLREKATSGALDPGFVLEEIRKIEVRLSELEGRLKLLVLVSPVLQENTDNVNLIESNILDANDRTAAARGEAAPALAGKISGTGRVVPSDEVLFFELKNLNNDEAEK